jgi:hypothetical protein
MASRVLSLRIDESLWDRIRDHAARRGMSAQDYVVRTLIRDDFDQRFQAAVEETDRFYAAPPAAPPASAPATARATAREPAPEPAPPAPAQTRPNAGIR